MTDFDSMRKTCDAITDIASERTKNAASKKALPQGIKKFADKEPGFFQRFVSENPRITKGLMVAAGVLAVAAGVAVTVATAGAAGVVMAAGLGIYAAAATMVTTTPLIVAGEANKKPGKQIQALLSKMSGEELEKVGALAASNEAVTKDLEKLRSSLEKPDLIDRFKNGITKLGIAVTSKLENLSSKAQNFGHALLPNIFSESENPIKRQTTAEKALGALDQIQGKTTDSMEKIQGKTTDSVNSEKQGNGEEEQFDEPVFGKDPTIEADAALEAARAEAKEHITAKDIAGKDYKPQDLSNQKGKPEERNEGR